MLLFSLLRNYELEEQGCTEHKLGADWAPMTSMCSAQCMEMKHPAQRERMHGKFLKRQECNHRCKRYVKKLKVKHSFCCALPFQNKQTNKLKVYISKYSCKLVQEQPQQLFSPRNPNRIPDNLFCGLTEATAPNPQENCYSQDPMN